MSGNGCREEIVAAAKAMETSGKADFSPGEMIRYLHQRGTKYSDSTIRTHVVSRMCANAPDNHAVTYPDLERVGRGRYRLRVEAKLGDRVLRSLTISPTVADVKAVPAESATKSGTAGPKMPGHDVAGRVVPLGGHPFRQICTIQPKRGTSGKFLEFVPAGRYVNSADLSLHKYGVGPFCSFRIPLHHHESGVYALTVSDAVVYVGECVDLSIRFNMGYGVISPRNCYTHGQSTNCRINNLILTTAGSGASVELWFSGASERKQIEDELINTLHPQWNR